MTATADPSFVTLGQAVGALIIGALTAAAVAFQNHVDRKRREKPNRPVESTVRDDLEISILLEVLRDRLNAQRCYFSQYHNGEKTLGDSDITRKSRTHERVRQGVSYQAENYRGMLTSTMPEEVEMVRDDNVSFRLVRDIPQSKFRWLCDEGGVRAVVRNAVKKHGQIIGFVGVDFDDEGYCDGTLTEPPDLHFVTQCAERIGRILAKNG